jgi:hypothetical protein
MSSSQSGVSGVGAPDMSVTGRGQSPKESERDHIGATGKRLPADNDGFLPSEWLAAVLANWGVNPGQRTA